jgi:glucose 1-dehydrogenase
MPGRLEGKIAVVTGAGSGIGQSIAIRLAQEGATSVIDFVTHPEQAQDTASKIASFGGKSISVRPTLPASPTAHA